ncbi:CcdB family protein [Proteus sp. TSJ240517]
MSQYTVYRNKSLKSKEQYPYFIDIQNELLSDIDSRVIIPITQLSYKNSQVEILTPII